jgi:hypothetical protein
LGVDRLSMVLITALILSAIPQFDTKIDTVIDTVFSDLFHSSKYLFCCEGQNRKSNVLTKSGFTITN